jgi:hypothetical protein
VAEIKIIFRSHAGTGMKSGFSSSAQAMSPSHASDLANGVPE